MTEQEKNERRMNSLTKAATVFTKLFEVGYQILAVGLIVGLVLFIIDRAALPGALVKGSLAPGEEISVHDFSIVIGNPDGSPNNTAIIIFLITGALTAELMGWVFRNANLILRTTQGLTKFSQGKTPFQKDNVRMMREIGIFFLAIAVVELAASSLAFLILGPEFAEVSINAASAVTGILMLCLSQVFALGMQMQKDVDGLV